MITACVTRPLVEIVKIGAFSTFNEGKSLDWVFTIPVCMSVLIIAKELSLDWLIIIKCHYQIDNLSGKSISKNVIKPAIES